MAEEIPTSRPAKRLKLSPSADSNGGTTSAAKHDFLQVPTGRGIVPDQKELEVGISAFVTKDTHGFTGLLKVRYTDFMVNEILPNGQVVHLTSTSVPEKFSTKRKQTKSEAQNGSHGTESSRPHQVAVEIVVSQEEGQNQVSVETKLDDHNLATSTSNKISEEDKQQLIQYLNPQAVSELLSLYQSILKHPQWKSRDHPVVRTEFTADRSIRGEIHGCIRRVFASRIDSRTDNTGILVLTAVSLGQANHLANNDNHPTRRPGKLGWADRGGDYLHFTLYKENKDTMEAISYLVRQMKINAKVFQFAGTKDRRAITAQRVSAYRVDMERLAAQNRFLRASSVGDFEYQPHGLELGDLTGNEFVITLRDCQFPETIGMTIDEIVEKSEPMLKKAMAALHDNGYLNYYGLQRFGTFATRTDTVGLHILQGDLKGAVEAILFFDPKIVPDHIASAIGSGAADISRFNKLDDTSRAIALSIFQKNGQLHKALDILPRKFSAESSLLRHLHRQPSDYYNALMSIPRNLRLMYVHAYQSLVWNNAATHRMSTYGSQVVEGDLVLVSEHRDKEETADQTAMSEDTAAAATSTDIDADGEIIVAPPIHDRANNLDDAFERARPLTAAEASSGQYSIFDVVLPLPGYDILYPDHETGIFYKTFMAEHGNLDPMDMRRKHRDFSLSGSYRKILSRIGSGWSVETKLYTHDEEQFVKTDFELLKEKQREVQQQKQQIQEKQTTIVGQDGDDIYTEQADDETSNPVPPQVQRNSEKEQQQSDTTQENQNQNQNQSENQKIAVILKFQLGSSQYATMALRELSHGGIVAYKPDYAPPGSKPQFETRTGTEAGIEAEAGAGTDANAGAVIPRHQKD